ncbi:MAG: nucleotidyl transferase AbiEii/AbiGii toxin family protein [Bacteroidota bacterium]
MEYPLVTNLHINNQLFQDAVIATAQRLNIPEIYIEKDYWVTVALHAIFHSAAGNDAVFKGGTALSKCHKLIERFSEDVDMVVLNNKGESGNQLKNKLKAITDSVSKIMPEIEIDGITIKKGMNRKTAHQYNKLNFSGSFGQVREQIIVEATWLGSSEPYIMSEVSCYVYEMMKVTNQDQIIEQYNLQPFTVKVLSKERTLCEKIMSLVRFSQTQDPYIDLANKIRHIYDVHLMLKDAAVAVFFNSIIFDELLVKVGQDDVVSYKNNNEWLKNHPATAMIFSKSDDTWDKIKNTYRTTFKELVMGEFPNEEELINTMKVVNSRLQKVKWRIDK